MAAHGRHNGDGPGEKVLPLRPQAGEEQARPKEEEPGQKAEIVRGVKPRRWESQHRSKEAVSPGEGPKMYPFKAQEASVHVPEEHEQGKGDRQAQPGRNAAKEVLQRHRHQGGKAQKGEHAAENGVLREDDVGHSADHSPGGKGDEAPAHRPPAQVNAVAGEEDEGPADALLPHVGAEGAVPAPVAAQKVHKVPAGVVEDHADEGRPPDGIDVVVPDLHSLPSPL